MKLPTPQPGGIYIEAFVWPDYPMRQVPDSSPPSEGIRGLMNIEAVCTLKWSRGFGYNVYVLYHTSHHLLTRVSVDKAI